MASDTRVCVFLPANNSWASRDWLFSRNSARSDGRDRWVKKLSFASLQRVFRDLETELVSAVIANVYPAPNACTYQLESLI